MLLEKPDAAVPADQRGQTHLWQSEQACGQFGVEELHRTQPQLHQIGQVLGGRMDDPLLVADQLLQGCQLRDLGLIGLECSRIDQYDARTGTLELQQVGLGRVPEALRAFNIDGDWTMTGPQGFECRAPAWRIVDH
ncbi:hypothetical protein SDC9_137113 [bioreactor metagenome]|uniref:Uncharacterized protein n=1 Tax=bioreactor metagenome TaxID=1076179 RepID=A0A645DL47_9ZZZZ